jgi:hypothetical protein
VAIHKKMSSCSHNQYFLKLDNKIMRANKTATYARLQQRFEELKKV